MNDNVPLAEWFYGTDGVRHGPVATQDLIAMIKSGEVSATAVVWREGMSNWEKITSTELAEYIRLSNPPPLSASQTNNGFIWALATAPLWGTVCQILAGNAWAQIKGGWVFYRDMWWVVVACNIAMSVLDFNALKKAGHDVRRLKGWMLALVPVYIFKRDKLLGADITRFCVWIAAWAASMFMI